MPEFIIYKDCFQGVET